MKRHEADGIIVAVVVNYRTFNATAAAVKSLTLSKPPLAEIVVVDNGSGDGSAEQLRGLPGVRLVEATDNCGFSAGCNIGIREALRLKAERILLINSDAVVQPDSIALLNAALDRDPTLGIVGPMILDRSKPGVVESIGIRYLGTTCRMRHLGFGARREEIRGLALPNIDAVSGCAMLIRREVFESIGLLNEDYFFGFEDLDFCLRARAAGHGTACVHTAAALHEGSLSIGKSSALRTYFATRNHLLMASRLAPERSFIMAGFQTASIVLLNLASVLLRPQIPRRQGFRGFLCGVRDHLAGRYGPAPSHAFLQSTPAP